MAPTTATPMKILFLCTAHNSLSQRLSLDLTAQGHEISIEYALSDAVMIEAVALFQPDLILCPFLTTKVPAAVYTKILTLIVHPGVPRDAGPSAIDWVLVGNDGTARDSDELLQRLETEGVKPGRSHWGVTVLQAVEQLDAGPVWAWEQFHVDIDEGGLTKSSLYGGPITRAAARAVGVAVARIREAMGEADGSSFSSLEADSKYAALSVTENVPFKGGKTHRSPLLKAAQGAFDPVRHSAVQVSRRIHSADSQPGVLTSVFGPRYYVYGGQIQEESRTGVGLHVKGVKVLRVRHEAVCIETADKQGVWITHLRRHKAGGGALWPKIPALICLLEDGVLTHDNAESLSWPPDATFSPSPSPTLEEITITFHTDAHAHRTAYLHFNFYNGATSTAHCARLLQAMDYILSRSTPADPIHALALMGSTHYFSNGIALNLIQASPDPALESWHNINAINDVVHHLLHAFPARGILTIAALRGNAAAGDVVIAGADVVLQPAYRALGLHGSEFHSLTYPARCGNAPATRILRAMLPVSALGAQRTGLVDYVFPGHGTALDERIAAHVALLLAPRCLARGLWKRGLDLSAVALARVRRAELAEMARDFWSARAVRYHSRREAFVGKVRARATPLRFAGHRRGLESAVVGDEEEGEEFDDVAVISKRAEDEIRGRVREEMEGAMNSVHTSTPGAVGDAGVGVLKSTTDGEQTLFPCVYQAERGDVKN